MRTVARAGHAPGDRRCDVAPACNALIAARSSRCDSCSGTPRIPEVTTDLGLSDGILGLAQSVPARIAHPQPAPQSGDADRGGGRRGAPPGGHRDRLVWPAYLPRSQRGGAVGSGVVVALSVAMFVSRSAGDAVMARVGRVRYLFGSSTVTALASVALLAENEDEDVPRSCECPAHTAPAELGSHLQRVR